MHEIRYGKRKILNSVYENTSSILGSLSNYIFTNEFYYKSALESIKYNHIPRGTNQRKRKLKKIYQYIIFAYVANQRIPSS